MSRRWIRKILSVTVTAALMLALAGCGSSSAETSAEGTTAEAGTTTETVSESAGNYTAGTYTATAAGRNGDVTLTVTFSDTAITDIQVESEETETIGVAAMDQLTEQVLANQSLGVDAVSGATLSSEAYLAALEDCVTQAGGDVDALKNVEVAAEETTVDVTEADVIVVGAGGAGLTAATTAAREGASVILLEKSSSVGGNTLCATMGINAAGSQVQADLGVEVTVEGLIEQQSNNDDALPNLVQAYAEASGEVIDFFSSLGVEFTNEGGNSDFMLMATADGKTATTMINAIYKELQATDVNLYLNMDVTTLVTDEEGNVTGCIATDASGDEVTFTGTAVVLCTGGFGQNQELLAEVNPELANAITDELAPTTGEGLLMAQELGADAVNLDAIQLFPHVISGYGLILPMQIPLSGIYVNNSAERFTTEAFEASDDILVQDAGEAYNIFPESDLNDTMQELINAGFVVSADSVEELAEKLELDAETLAATVEQWNADCEAGTDSQYEREADSMAKLEGTIYGYKFGVGAHYFMGGILINENTQVLDTDGNVISGLYAAGEVTGGFHGTTRVDGSGLGDAFIFGRIAGFQASAAALGE